MKILNRVILPRPGFIAFILEPIGVQEFDLHDRIVRMDLANCSVCKTTLITSKSVEYKKAAA